VASSFIKPSQIIGFLFFVFVMVVLILLLSLFWDDFLSSPCSFIDFNCQEDDVSTKPEEGKEIRVD
jgi:hypothetical protein